MRRDYTSNWMNSPYPTSITPERFTHSRTCVPKWTLLWGTLLFLGVSSSSIAYVDEIPLRAVAPDEGMPPAPAESTSGLDEESRAISPLRPYNNPENLRFRPTPLRGATESQARNLELEPEAHAPTAKTPVRSAGAENEKEWQVEHINPLRKTGTPKKNVIPPTLAKPIDSDPASGESKDIKEPSASPNTEPSSVPATPPTAAKTSDTKDLWNDAQLVVPSQPSATSKADTENEMMLEETKVEEHSSDTVLHLEDDEKSEQPAPLPPGVKQQDASKKNTEKGFDPEDNDQPAPMKSHPDSAESESDDARVNEESNEPQSSELLKLLQDNSGLEVSGDSAGQSGAAQQGMGGTDSKPKIQAKEQPKPSREVAPSKPVVVAPSKQAIKVLPQTARLRPRIDTALNYYLFRPESNVERSPWAVFHAILPFGSETTLRADGRTVSAINWMCFNGSCRGQRIFIPQKDGTFRPAVGAGVQGHEGQFLGILAQSRVPANYPLQVGRKRYTVEDLIEYEMRTCQAKTELTFKLIALSHYLVNDATWVNDKGEEWSLERLVEEELAQPIIGAACGGTHRLMGLSYALKQRKAAGLPIDGQYARAEVFLNDFVDYAWTLQNPDGSFSTEWFEGRGNKQDMQRKLQTTGHIVEWLVFTLPDEELQSPRMLKSIEFLTYCLVEQRQTDWKIGPRSHALHALAMYQERLFGITMGTRRNLATSNSRNQRR